MHNFDTNFGIFLEICKKFSKNYAFKPRRGPVPKMSDLEVIALALTAEYYQINSENHLFYLLKNMSNKFVNLISRRQFNDRRKSLIYKIKQIRQSIADLVNGDENIFIIDSKPIPVCKNARFKRSKICKDSGFEKAPSTGYCSAQKMFYYGYKLHVVCGLSGMIHSFDFSKAKVHDVNYLRDVRYDYSDCTIIGDKGYISKTMQLNLFETANINLEVPYRKNQHNYQPVNKPAAKARKRIETLFSQLDDIFLTSKNYAKHANGLFARIISKISALTIVQYINLIQGRPMNKIKNALFS